MVYPYVQTGRNMRYLKKILGYCTIPAFRSDSKDLTPWLLWVACLRQDHQANAKYAFVAQLAEHFTRNEGVMGSSPIKSFLKILV